MPNYKFFQIKKDGDQNQQQEVQFNEFQLKTRMRSESRKKRSKSANSESEMEVCAVDFKARKMPEFKHPLAGVAVISPKKLTQSKPFALSTLSRGKEKEKQL